MRALVMVLSLAAICVAQPSTVATVTEVAGSRVRLRLPEGCSPAVDDRLELLARIPGFDDPVPVEGAWRVTAVETGFASAEAAGQVGAAQPGNTAVIRCSTPARPAERMQGIAGANTSAPGASAPGSVAPAERMQGIAGANTSAPGPSAPSSLPPPTVPLAVPAGPQLAIYPIRHAHPSFTRTAFASARLTFSPSSGLWMYTEAGGDAKPDHVYGFFCKDLKSARGNKLNRNELATLDGVNIPDPMKLSIQAGRSLEQLVGSTAEVEAIVNAFAAACGKR